MPLYIKDETAGVLLLTIDNNGLICFGDGTPVKPAIDPWHRRYR